MARADVAAVDQARVIKQARAVRFFGCLQSVDKASEQLALDAVALLRGSLLFSIAVVVTDVVTGHLDVLAVKQALHGLA